MNKIGKTLLTATPCISAVFLCKNYIFSNILECRSKHSDFGKIDERTSNTFLSCIRSTDPVIPKDVDVNMTIPNGGWTLMHAGMWLIIGNNSVSFILRLYLSVACVNANLESVSRLIERGADVNAVENQPTFRSASHLSYYQAIRENYLSEQIASNANTDGFTPLHYAVINGSEDVVKLLLEAGADPTIKSSLGFRPKDYFDAEVQSPSLLALLETGEQRLSEQRKSLEKELRRKYPLEKQLSEVIVGQKGPINNVGSAVRRKENGWHDEGRPLVFLFLGSSGIGKTELAKQLAKYIHKDDNSGFIRIDMSEFQSKHEVAKFIGSPPGYVGYDEGGQLTKRLAEKPNAVVLLDEVEKAHIDVLTIMLQVFDEGRLTDGKGTTIDCRDAIFIMTSNLAQTEIADEAEILRIDVEDKGGLDSSYGEEDKSLSRDFVDHKIYPILRSHFKRDEFLGRINEVLFFLPFNQLELEQIVELEMRKWAKKAREKHSMNLEWSHEVVTKLTEGYNIRYGARSIKYEVEKKVVNLIAKAHELDDIHEGSVIKLFLDSDGKVRLSYTKPEQKSKYSLW
jgi:ATP-dependent Clp protease ATP-binding subunit ClpB